MEDVVAVEVRLSDGSARYFITWGRIQDSVDPTEVEALVLAFSYGCALGGEPVEATICPTLGSARDAPYFYEAIITFTRSQPKHGESYEKWRRRMDRRMRKGKEIDFLGTPALVWRSGAPPTAG